MTQSIQKKYYVYELVNPNTNQPFYIGKGSGKRAELHTIKAKLNKKSENPYKDNVIKMLLQENKEPIINIIEWFDYENLAYDAEEKLIQLHGRKVFDEGGILTNICTDARPPHNECTAERRELYRNMMIGNTINKGRVQTDEEKRKKSESLKRAYDSGTRTVTDKMREVTGNTHRGKIVSLETREKMAIAGKNNGRKGKTFIEIFGAEKAKEIKEKISGRLPKNAIPIEIDGVSYISIKHAAIALSTTEYKLLKYYDYKKI